VVVGDEIVSSEDVPLSTLITTLAPTSRAFATECGPKA
jgi:hypothetical protein